MIIHETLGLIDLRAFTTFGINAKPNTNSPIGYFGTGLKYAIAVRVREGLKVTVWIGTEPHEFYCEPSNFRGKDFSLIRMRRQRGVTRKWMATDLPFTTELGKNWKLWMALRELHSNTLDENGLTIRGKLSGEIGKEGCTRIVVEGDAYEQEFNALGEIFLVDRPKAESQVSIATSPSKHGYFRGMRVYDLQRPSLYTYSVEAKLDLTEDRTLVHTFMWDYYVRCAIMALTDKDQIKKILEAKDDTYESGINWRQDEYDYCTPEFLHCVRLYGKKSTTVFMRHERQVKVREMVSWNRRLIDALEADNNTEILDVARANKDALLFLLKSAYYKSEQESDAALMASAATEKTEEPTSQLVDDIPL